MKRLILSSLALAAIAGSAFAQQPPPPPPAAPPIADEAGAPPPRGPRGDMPDRERRPPPPPPPSKAAHFRIEQGDTRIDLKCADDEPMKACSDLLIQLIDRVKADPKP